jgi:putative acetyltransferase
VAVRLVAPQSDDDWRGARRLVEEYAASLQLDLAFQDFAHEIEHLRTEYAPPTGAFLLADDAGALVGCIGVRKLADRIGEIKRLYVVPTARGQGIGRLLAQAIVEEARTLSYLRLRLDTLPSMKEAQALYESLGFRLIPAYRFNPVEGTAFLELVL